MSASERVNRAGGSHTHITQLPAARVFTTQPLNVDSVLKWLNMSIKAARFVRGLIVDKFVCVSSKWCLGVYDEATNAMAVPRLF